MFNNFSSSTPPPEFKRTKVGQRYSQRIAGKKKEADDTVLLLETSVPGGDYLSTIISVEEFPDSNKPGATKQKFIFKLEPQDNSTAAPIFMRFWFFDSLDQTKEQDETFHSYGLTAELGIEWADLVGLQEHLTVVYKIPDSNDPNYGYLRNRTLVYMPPKLQAMIDEHKAASDDMPF